MEVIPKLMGVVVHIISLTLATFILPSFLLFKLFKFFFRSIFTEKVAGKVVLITGASSGIGEHLAYEYAKRGACLALVDRREDRLQLVADKARRVGSPDVVAIHADVSKFENCKNFVDEAVDHFGRLDHLVNNAGICPFRLFEDYNSVTDHASVMDINFWGSVYSTQFAMPHLKKSKGRIIVISSVAGWSPLPGCSIYAASKGALNSFYETLRVELGYDIGVTIVTPGAIESEIMTDDLRSKVGLDNFPLESAEVFARAVVNGINCGARHVHEPAWVGVLFLWRVFLPEVLDWSTRSALVKRTSQNNAIATKNINPVLTQSLDFKAD